MIDLIQSLEKPHHNPQIHTINDKGGFMKKEIADRLASWHEMTESEQVVFIQRLIDNRELDEEILEVLRGFFLEEISELGPDAPHGPVARVLHRVLDDLKSRSAKATDSSAYDDFDDYESLDTDEWMVKQFGFEDSTDEDLDGQKAVDTVSASKPDPIQDQQDSLDSPSKKSKGQAIAREALLEFSEASDGSMVLREVGSQEEPLVRIAFSDKVKQMLGDDAHAIGQIMIHAAFAKLAQQQSNFYHAQVFDEEPMSYS